MRTGHEAPTVATPAQLMPTRRCLDCPALVEDATRCPACRSARERDRGTRQERGLGADHDARLRDPAYIAATHCVTCGRPFTDDNPKTGGHVVARRHGGGDGSIEPQCADCNYGWRRTGA